MVESSAASAIASISAATTGPRRAGPAGRTVSGVAGLVLPTPGSSPESCGRCPLRECRGSASHLSRSAREGGARVRPKAEAGP
ncbi:hypothetical protein GCM10018772_32670 [Streptomyces fumanus]|uniref:Uncharacterized protein n=1 Tax=Streptomyces fumanus TaxID=67302 RepID=A0A919AFQ1_9ACTN|nr:hypothetical protein GCM10018772_32670 [Streptomyces fumanus]